MIQTFDELDEKTEHMKATEKFLLDFVACGNMCTQLICETDNIVHGGYDAEHLRDKDDKNTSLKKENLSEVSTISSWFVENRENQNHEKMVKYIEYLICKKRISALSESSEKIAIALNEKESQDIVDRAKAHLLKDPELFVLMCKRINIFDMLRDEIVGNTKLEEVVDKDIISKTPHVSEAYFRRARALWNNPQGTPGFEGSENPTFSNFHKLRKVQLVTKGDHAGNILENLEGKGFVSVVPSGVKDIDIFTVDVNISSKLKAYFAETPTFQRWKSFVQNEYMPGSAVFFHPTIVGSPVETSKHAFLAFCNRKPAHCFDRNAITEQGLNMNFFTFFLGVRKIKNGSWVHRTNLKPRIQLSDAGSFLKRTKQC